MKRAEHELIYAADAAKMSDKDLADHLVTVVTYPKGYAPAWRRAVAAEAAQRLRDIAFPDLDDAQHNDGSPA